MRDKIDFINICILQMRKRRLKIPLLIRAIQHTIKAAVEAANSMFLLYNSALFSLCVLKGLILIPLRGCSYMILLSEVGEVELFEWGPIEEALQHLPNSVFLKESGWQCLFFYQPLQYAMTNESSNCFLPLVLSFLCAKSLQSTGG